MNRNSSNSTNQYGAIGSGMAASSMTPQSAVDVEDSPMFYYHNNNSYGGLSSQNSEDVKMLKSIQKKSKRRQQGSFLSGGSFSNQSFYL